MTTLERQVTAEGDGPTSAQAHLAQQTLRTSAKKRKTNTLRVIGNVVLFGLLAGGLVVLHDGFEDSGLVRVLVGGLMATVGLGLLVYQIRLWALRHGFWWQVGIGVLLVTGGVAVVVNAYDEEAILQATIGVVSALLGAFAFLALPLRRLAERYPCWFVGGGLVVSLAGCFGLLVGFLGAVPVVLVGLMTTQLGLRRGCTMRGRAVEIGAGLLTVGTAAVLGGGLASTGWIVGFGLFGIVLGSMAVAAGLRRRRKGRPITGRPAVLLLLASVATAIYGVILLDVSGVTRGNAATTAAVAIAVVLIGGSPVWRGEGIFFAIVIAFVAVWALVDRSIPDEQAANSNDGRVQSTAGVVAFGDSFISGEGAEKYFAGTDQKGSERNECRRADTAYPALLADSLGGGLNFFACSGAVVADVIPDPSQSIADQENPADPRTEPVAVSGESDGGDGSIDGAVATDLVVDTDTDTDAADTDTDAEGTTTDSDAESTDQPSSDVDCADRSGPTNPVDPLGESRGQYPSGPAGVYGSRLQIDNLALDANGCVVDPAETRVVLVSIGGNDALFGDIVKGCLIPGSCTERRSVWLDNVETLGPGLTATYSRIRATFGRDIPVVVMPYPLVVSEDSCSSSPFETDEHEFVVEFTSVINRRIKVSAERAGVNFFAPGMFAFEDHRVCDDGEPAINLIELRPTDADFPQRLLPNGWTHNSMHPNEFGHELMFEALSTWLIGDPADESDGFLDRVDDGTAGVPANPEPNPNARFELGGLTVPTAFAIDPVAIDLDQSQCQDGRGAFGTLIRVIDEDASAQQLVPLPEADPDQTVCFTDEAGNWRAAKPGESSDPADPEAEQLVLVQDDEVILNAKVPERGLQWVVFETRDGAWRTLGVRYCSIDPDCEATLDEWMSVQWRSAQDSIVPIIAVFLISGWLFAFWWVLSALPNLRILWQTTTSSSAMARSQRTRRPPTS